jgi:hypothetical protein
MDKPERGRPKLDPEGKASTLMALRVIESERTAYDRAAKRAGLKVSAWMRDRLNKAVKRESKRD